MRSQKTNREFFAIFAYSDSCWNFATFAVKKILLFNSILIPLFFIYPRIADGQSEKYSENIIEIAEQLAADDSDPEAVSVFTERLNELAENPVKINSSGEAEISRLFFLSDFQVKALAEYIHSTGQIVSVYELAAIPGFERETAEMILPFIILQNKLVNNSDSARWRNTILSDFSIKSGIKDTSSLGSNWRVLTKYKFTSGRFSGGFTMEKDPGEKLISGSPPLPDFLSAYFAYSGTGIIRKIVAGDYSLRFGEGTNINTGIRTGISLTSPGYMSANDEIKPYTSTGENGFFRGIATEFVIKNLEGSLFFSKNTADASIDSSADSGKYYIKNFYIAGIHNTPLLLKEKDAVSELAYGLSLSYNINNLKVGLVWSENRFSLPLNFTQNDPEKIYDFSGKRNDLYTFYYNYLIRKFLFYGELSINKSNKYAVVQGMSFRPSDRLTINFLFRNYDPGYITFFGQGPGAGSKTTNETGFLGNFTFEAAKHLFISGGCDIQHYPWLKYRCSAPTLGVRKEIKIRYLPSEKLSIDAYYDYHLTMADSADEQGIPSQKVLVTKSFKISAHYSVHDNLTLGTRIDFKTVPSSGSRGMILCQDLSYNFRKIPVTLWVRYCLFNTGSWDSRIYTYENDLLNSYSIPALYGEGSRSYIMVKWKTGSFSEVRIKYGITSSVTQGMSMANTEEIKMQFRVWF
jgi:hypothetical protein